MLNQHRLGFLLGRRPQIVRMVDHSGPFHRRTLETSNGDFDERQGNP